MNLAMIHNSSHEIQEKEPRSSSSALLIYGGLDAGVLLQRRYFITEATLGI